MVYPGSVILCRREASGWLSIRFFDIPASFARYLPACAGVLSGSVPYRVREKSVMATLILLRHGESTWNRENRFTGWTDIDLSAQGIKEAH